MQNERIFYDDIHARPRNETRNVHFVTEIENESNICRYMDLLELMYLIKEHKLEFKQLSLFDDPNENRIFLGEDIVQELYQEYEETMNISSEKFLENVKSLQTIDCLKIYGLCFTLNYDDKYMWDNYSDKQVMVKVKNIKALAKSFESENVLNPDIYIEKVQYVDTHNLHVAKQQVDKYFTHPYLAAFIKDQAYEKEREIRSICQVDTIYEGKNVNPVTASLLPPVLQINTDPNQFIKEIVLSPYLPESKQEMIRSMIKSWSPHLTVSQSRVKSTPHLYKKILREIDFSQALPIKIRELGDHKQITINDDGTFEIEMKSG